MQRSMSAAVAGVALPPEHREPGTRPSEVRSRRARRRSRTRPPRAAVTDLVRSLTSRSLIWGSALPPPWLRITLPTRNLTSLSRPPPLRATSPGRSASTAATNAVMVDSSETWSRPRATRWCAAGPHRREHCEYVFGRGRGEFALIDHRRQFGETGGTERGLAAASPPVRLR